MSAAEPARARSDWWIRAGERVYGPFASERLPPFVREGRLTPETAVSRDEAGPWLAAGVHPSLGALFEPAAPRERAAPPAAAPVGATSEREVRTPTPAPERPEAALLVFAELADAREPAFHAALGRLGRVARARPGVWLLRGRVEAAGLRNALSQALGEGESLLIAAADGRDAAWFNLGGEADRALRGLWSEGAQPAGPSSRT